MTNLSTLSKYYIHRSYLTKEQLLLVTLNCKDEGIKYEFFVESKRVWAVPNGACGNAGMPRMCSLIKGLSFRHPNYGGCKILDVTPINLNSLHPQDK